MVEHLEGVVLGGDLSDEVRADEGNLLHDILSYTGDIGKEEEGEETSSGTEAGTHETAMKSCVSETIQEFNGVQVGNLGWCVGDVLEEVVL